MVRIVKNMRNRAVADGRLAAGTAPSYFLEGMLYNVPNDQYGKSYGQSVANALIWLRACDRTALVTVSGRHYLLRSGQAMSWAPEDFETFLTALIDQWNRW